MTPSPTTTADPFAAHRALEEPEELEELKRRMRDEMLQALRGEIPGWDEQKHRAKALRVARSLRDGGLSYEEITLHMPYGATGDPLTVWETYAFANPGKSAAQIMAWRRKHFPGSLSPVAGSAPERGIL